MLERIADGLARELARQVFLVDGIAEAGAEAPRIRALQPFFVRAGGGEMVVLAGDAMAAAELSATGGEVSVTTIRGHHRVVPLPRGRWAVAALPRWLAFLGKMT